MTPIDFYPFETQSKSDWLKLVEKDLKGKDFDQTLVSSVWGQIRQEPFYTREDLPGTNQPMRFHPPSDLPGMSPRLWSNAVSIYNTSDPKTNEEILNHLQNGADALILHLEGNENWDTLLKGVLLEYISIYLLPENNELTSIWDFIQWLKNQKLGNNQLHGALLWSPTSPLFEGQSDFSVAADEGAKLLEAFAKFPDFRACTIDLARYNNSGGTGIQEITFGLGELIEITTHWIESGLNAQFVFENIAFHSAVGSAHFPEIVKLKSLRKLISDVTGKFGAAQDQESIHLLCSTSQFSKSYLDKNSNYIRQTYEASAAIIGGCNTLWVRPAEGESAGSLETRIARNVSTVLREESYLDKVIDPSAGAYYLESIQAKLEDILRQNIAELEKNGGWLAQFKSRIVQKEIREARKSTQELIVNHEKVIIGANYSIPDEKLVNNLLFHPIQEEEYALLPTRATYLLESKKLNQ
ncbi:MAG: methylmalonyl-CoA mutase family protein [Bacteroidota bacterium]